MAGSIDELERKLNNENIRHGRWRKLVSVLGCVVVFCTTYALVLPAITKEQEPTCGWEEHVHTTECYVEDQVLICEIPEGHVHTEACYEMQEVAICGLEEYGPHTHTEGCYYEEVSLVCGLEERMAHMHTEGCYNEEGTLICGQMETEGHTHSSECMSTKQVLACGFHTHTEGCYNGEGTLICGLKSTEGHTHTSECMSNKQVLVCDIPEGHDHEEACYETQEELVCEKEEHEHTDGCYADIHADVETYEDWVNSVSCVELSGNWSKDVAAIAESQLGYTESERNFIIDEYGARKGYTRYGAWYGLPYEDWCAMFCSFCLRFAGVPEDSFPISSGCRPWIAELSALGMYEVAGGAYIPKPGDLVFFDPDSDGKADHVGIVCQYTKASDEERAYITTVEGNNGSSVGYSRYEIGNAPLLGYGVLPQNPLYEYELSAEGTDYSLSVRYTAASKLPESVKMSVEEIAQDSEEYKSYLEMAGSLRESSLASDIQYARFFKVSLTDGEKELQPAAPVTVKIAYKEFETDKYDETIALSVAKDGTLCELETELTDDNVLNFKTETFSVLGTVGATFAEDFTPDSAETGTKSEPIADNKENNVLNEEYLNNNTSIYDGQLTSEELMQASSDDALASTVYVEPKKTFAAKMMTFLGIDESPKEENNYRFSAYYMGEKDSENVTKVSNFRLKYQMNFSTDVSIGENELRIVVPRYLLEDRYGGYCELSQFSVSKGTPDNPVAARTSPLNYYYDIVNGVESVVFFNYKSILAGTSMSWQVFYSELKIADVINNTAWTIDPYAEITVPDDTAEDPEATTEPEESEPKTKTITLYANNLTGHVENSVDLNKDSVTKTAYSSGENYSPELYTAEQIRVFAPNAKSSEIDFQNYYYIVWQVKASGNFTQAWQLYMKEMPKYGEGDTASSEGCFVVGMDSKLVQSGDYAGWYLMSTYKNNYREKDTNNFAEAYYVVVAYPKTESNGENLNNSVEIRLQGEDMTADEAKRATVNSAPENWDEYEWDGNSSYNIVNPGKDVNSKELIAWKNVYEYYKNKATPKDYGGISFNARNESFNMLSTYNWNNSVDGVTRYEYIPDTYVTMETVDENLTASGQALSKDDYYFSAVKINRTEHAYDFYADKLAVATTSGMDFSKNSDMTVYAKFAVSAEGVTADENGWEQVAVVSWNNQSLTSYTFTAEQLAREPYAVKAVYDSMCISKCSIATSVMIRHDSPVFEKLFFTDGNTIVTLTNTSNHKITPSDGCTGYVKGNTKNYSASVKLSALQSEAKSTKSSTVKNNTVAGRYDITYTLTAYESYLMSDSQTVSILKQAGVNSICGRNEVVFYDLLPADVQFDASSGIQAYRNTGLNSYSSSGVSVSVNPTRGVDVIDNWRGTGRTMVIFHVHYSGSDASAFNSGHWLTGYKIVFNAYKRWEETAISLEPYNIAAYMPATGDMNPLVGTDAQVCFDDGKNANGSVLNGNYAPFASQDKDGNIGDINADGITNIRNVLYAETLTSADYPISSQSGIRKEVKAGDDIVGSYDTTATVLPGKDYRYNLILEYSAYHEGYLNDIWIYDHIENAITDRYGKTADPYCGHYVGGECWTGTFQGMDLRAAKSLGIQPVVYYSTNVNAPLPDGKTSTTANTITQANGWYEASAFLDAGHTLAEVKSIAVDLTKKTNGEEFKLNEKTPTVRVEFLMKAPDDFLKNTKDEKILYAYNNPAYTASDTGARVCDQGDAVCVTMGEDSIYILEKTAVDMPDIAKNQKFAFTIKQRVGSSSVLFENKFNKLENYNTDTGTWDEVDDISEIGALGKLNLQSGQRAIYAGGEASKLFAEETIPSIFWKSEKTIETPVTDADTGITTYTEKVVNKWRPPVYIIKTLGYIPTNLDVTNEKYNFRVSVWDETKSDYVPLANSEYSLVDSAIVSQYANPTVKGTGTTDENGILSITKSQIAALFPGTIGTKFKVEEVYKAGDTWKVVPNHDATLDGDCSWVCDNATQEGILSDFGNKLEYKNYYRYKELRLTKAITRQELSECTQNFTFTIEDDDGAVSGLNWYMVGNNGNKVLDDSNNPIGGTTGTDGKITAACAGCTIVVNGFDYSKAYTVTEASCDNYKCEDLDGVVNGVAALGFSYEINSVGLTFTNQFLLRDLSITKEVLSNGVDPIDTTVAFEMHLERKNDEDTFEDVANQEYSLIKIDGSTETKETDENGYFSLCYGEKALFKDIAKAGAVFKVTETPNADYPPLEPLEGESLVLTMSDKDIGAEGTIVNGVEGLIRVKLQWSGTDSSSEKWLDFVRWTNSTKVENKILGASIEVKLDKDGDGIYEDITAADQLRYFMIDKNGNVVGNIEDMTSGSIIYDYPTSYSLILTSSHEDWKNWSYQVTETQFTAPEFADKPWDGSLDVFTLVVGSNGAQTSKLLEIGLKPSDLAELKGVKTTVTGTVENNPVAQLDNTVSISGLDWVYKYLYNSEDSANILTGSKLVWQLQRYDGSFWVPASGVEYVVSYDKEDVLYNLDGSAICTTGADGRIVLEAGVGPEKIKYELAVGFRDEVNVGITSGMRTGDLRVVELEDDEEYNSVWGSLVAYADENGNISTTDKPANPRGFVNSAGLKTIRLEKRMDNGVEGEGPFTFSIVRTFYEQDIIGSGLHYQVYNTATDELVLDDLTTDKNGELTLYSGQYAIITVPEETLWTITEKLDPIYQLKTVELDEDEVDNGSELDFRKHTADLTTGANINTELAKNNSTLTNVIFASSADYPNVVSAGNGINVDEENYGTAGDGAIKLYWSEDNTSAYILSDDTICANADCSNMFSNLAGLTSIDFSNFNTSKTTNMSRMFYGYDISTSLKLTALDLSGFDTSNVTDMSNMFYRCSKLTSLDVSNFDTSNVTNMYGMFYGCGQLTSLDVSGFDTSNVTNMSGMFQTCRGCTELDLSNFDTSRVTDMSSMFQSCAKLTELDLSNFDTSNVTNMSRMFMHCNKLDNFDFSNFNTSNVTDMSHMFYNCYKVTELDLSNFDTSKVTSMRGMFGYCNCLSSLNLSGWDTSNVTDMAEMFYVNESGSSKLTTLDLSGFDTGNVTNMYRMFHGLNSLTTLDVSNFDTSKVTNMEKMFKYCTKLTELDCSNFDTSNVTNMYEMFDRCYNLVTLDLSNWDPNKMQKIGTDSSYGSRDMFYMCTNLKTIYAVDWTQSGNTHIIRARMFTSCNNLVGGDGTKHVGDSGAYCKPVGGYFTIKPTS